MATTVTRTRRIALCTVSALMLGATSAGAIEAGKTSPVLAAQDSGERRSGGALGNIFGCQASGNKQEIGAVAGGAVGGLLGNRIAGRGSRTLGTIIGGVFGAAAGSVLGCKLQKNDQAKAERALENAVATNKSQTWQSDESGASGRVDVSQSTNGVALGDLKFASGVEPASGYTKVAAPFTAAGSANIRSAPATSASVVGRLAAGQTVWVPASVKGAPWMLVSENGVGKGYVSSALLRRAATTVTAASGCKQVKQTISVPGAADESETFRACKGASGQWEMTRV